MQIKNDIFFSFSFALDENITLYNKNISILITYFLNF